jgi:hypothetical protein
VAYDLSGHPLRSRAVKRLKQPELVNQELIARAALDQHIREQYSLAPFELDPQDPDQAEAYEQARGALVRQINRQVAEPENPYLESRSKGSRSESFGISRDIGGTVTLDPIAVKIWRKVAQDAAGAAVEGGGTGWALFKGHR